MGDEAFDFQQYMEIYPAGSENHFWNLFRNNKILRKIRQIGANNILEVGCGRGYVVNYLRENGVDAYGVELSVHATPYCREVEPFMRVGCDAAYLDREHFNDVECIMLLDVIEHIKNPETLVSALARKADSCRFIIFTVPACMELWSAHDDYNNHYKRYDFDSFSEFCRLIPDSKLLSCEYFFHSLYPVMKHICKRTSNKDVGLSSINTLSKKLFHRLAYGYFCFDDVVFPRHIKGSSLLGVISLNSTK